LTGRPALSVFIPAYDEAVRLPAALGHLFDIELPGVATALGYRLAEVPVSWVGVSRSTVRLCREAGQMMQDFLRSRRQLRAKMCARPDGTEDLQ
jgi:hypothetical protein